MAAVWVARVRGREGFCNCNGRRGLLSLGVGPLLLALALELELELALGMVVVLLRRRRLLGLLALTLMLPRLFCSDVL